VAIEHAFADLYLGIALAASPEVPVLQKIIPVFAALAVLSPGTAQAAAVEQVPPVMAALGDSISAGFNACGWYVSCTSRSWSAGDNSEVNSHYLRLLGRSSVIKGHNLNFAVPGTTSAGLAGQAAEAVARHASYVTILIGAQDACVGTERDMTPVATFRRRIDEAMDVLRSSMDTMPARVFVASIPDLQRLWRIGKDNAIAKVFWAVGRVCPSMLANPASTAKKDQARRERVRGRVMDYNDQLAQACAGYGPECRFDGGAVFSYPYTLKMISPWDYFHPNSAGQRALAEATFRAGFVWEGQT
jgi:lysophospholipase L1-like esterase